MNQLTTIQDCIIQLAILSIIAVILLWTIIVSISASLKNRSESQLYFASAMLLLLISTSAAIVYLSIEAFTLLKT